jgi:hypothetical protein
MIEPKLLRRVEVPLIQLLLSLQILVLILAVLQFNIQLLTHSQEVVDLYLKGFDVLVNNVVFFDFVLMFFV